MLSQLALPPGSGLWPEGCAACPLPEGGGRGLWSPGWSSCGAVRERGWGSHLTLAVSHRKGPGQQLEEGRARETPLPVAPPSSCRTGQSAPHPLPGSSSQLLGGEWLGFFPPALILPFFCLQQPLGGGQQICWKRWFPGPHGLAARAENLELVPLEHSPLGPSLGMEAGGVGGGK